MYYIVTGAAGFIGSNLVRALNDRGIDRIIAVDDLTSGDKFRNLVDCSIVDYVDSAVFRRKLAEGVYVKAVKAVFHQGACSDTTESDGRFMMDNNYTFSQEILHACSEDGVPLIYASSAAVYGASTTFRETPEFERPLNVYGYSKLLFDQYVRRHAATRRSQVVGLRYFNVYGNREQHKGRMASVAFHCFNQFRANGAVKLFEGCQGYGDGEQLRDFVSVEDVAKVNLFFLDHPQASGIFNVGTGAAQSFNDVAVAAIGACIEASGKPAPDLAAARAAGYVQYIPFPADLAGKYQSYTQADLNALRAAGYADAFLTVEQGVRRYVSGLLSA